MVKKRVTAVLFIIIIFIMAAGSAVFKLRSAYSNGDFAEKDGMRKAYSYIRTCLSGAKSAEAFKEDFIDINGLFQRVIGRKVVDDADPSDDVVKLNNGMLTFVAEKSDVTGKAYDIKKLNKFLQERNIGLLYVQAPYKISKYDSELPEGVKSYANEMADEMISDIGHEVDYIDLRTEMHNDGMDQYDYFFKTDHHWTPEGAFYGFTKVASILKTQYGFEFDDRITDINNYDKKVYEKWFLGSEGKRVGVFYTGVDDISLYTPKFETDFNMTFPVENISKKGDFYDTLIYHKPLEKVNYYNSNPYAMYTGGDYAEQNIINNTSLNDKKILLIRDSFGCAFSPFLSLTCRELNVLDLRHYNESTVYEYVKKTKPDMVILLFNPNGIQDVG